MLISCPQCHFCREITISQIPQNAVMATCPKCQNRFKFRSIENDPVEYSNLGPSTSMDLSSDENMPNVTDKQYLKNTSENFDDTLPTDTFTPPLNEVPNDTVNKYNNQHKNKTFFTNKKIEQTSSAEKKQPSQSYLDLIPWEHPEKFDFFSSFYQTVVRVMFNAPIFFTNITNATSSLLRPLFFYILLRLFQTLMDGIWFMVSFKAIEPSITESSLHDLLGTLAQEMTLPMTLIVTPVTLAIQLGLYTLLFHIMIRLVQPEKASFTTTFRVIAYSAAPTIVCIVPVIGSLVGSIWFSISCFIGCKYALKLSWEKTALALIPLYLIAIAIGIQGANQFMHIGR